MELILFYIAATVALFSTVFALTRSNAAHALIYLIVSLLAVAVIFFLLGAPFAAALEVIVYAGAIMVLFIFVVMLLNIDSVPLDFPMTRTKYIFAGASSAAFFSVFLYVV